MIRRPDETPRQRARRETQYFATALLVASVLLFVAAICFSSPVAFAISVFTIIGWAVCIHSADRLKD